jgi:hypothetical protein
MTRKEEQSEIYWLLLMLLMLAVLVITGFVLAGCATVPGEVKSLKPVCDALGPPHVYNAKNKDSPWHAGPKVAPRLRRDNNVGENLRCPGYG